MKRRRNASHPYGRIVHNAVNVFCRHIRANLFGDGVQAGHIDLRAPLDPIDHLSVFDQTPVRYDRARDLHFPQPFIKSHMTSLVLTAAPAPAGIISLYFVLS